MVKFHCHFGITVFASLGNYVRFDCDILAEDPAPTGSVCIFILEAPPRQVPLVTYAGLLFNTIYEIPMCIRLEIYDSVSQALRPPQSEKRWQTMIQTTSSVALDEKMYDALKTRASVEQREVAEEVREAVDEWILRDVELHAEFAPMGKRK